MAGYPVPKLDERTVAILEDHFINGLSVTNVARKYDLSRVWIYRIINSQAGLRWMMQNVAPGHHALNLRVQYALNERLDTQVNKMPTADLIRLLMATTPKDLSPAVIDNLREQAEQMANENGLEGAVRERFIEAVLGGLQAA